MSCSYELGMELVEECVLCWAFRRKGGASKGGREEQAIDATKGPLAREFRGIAGNHEREPDELSVMTRHSNREAGGVEEVRGSSSGCEGCEECIEGEPGGETDTQGRGGCHGDPLPGLPLCCGILSSQGRKNCRECPRWMRRPWRNPKAVSIMKEGSQSKPGLG
jgi:hypothetical protein